MSADFIKMVSEIHGERYLLQVQNLIRNKIPCGFFTGFSLPNNISATVNNLKINGCGSGKGRGNVVGNFIDLDTYVERKNLSRVDYIKLDIEGAELDMLHGAAKTISRWKPKMAVSAYHKPEDLWTLATYIKSIRPDYEFKFRHYKINATEYGLSDKHRKFLKKLDSSYFVQTDREKVLYCR